MENNNTDILHSGALENLEDYRVFRRRFPSRNSLPTRIITDWYIQEIPVTGRKYSKWICLVGTYKDAVIRTSPITSVISPKKVCTSNCIYVLENPTKVCQYPLLGIETMFLGGFPMNWEEIIEKAMESRMMGEFGDIPCVLTEENLQNRVDKENMALNDILDSKVEANDECENQSIDRSDVFEKHASSTNVDHNAKPYIDYIHSGEVAERESLKINCEGVNDCIEAENLSHHEDSYKERSIIEESNESLMKESKEGTISQFEIRSREHPTIGESNCSVTKQPENNSIQYLDTRIQNFTEENNRVNVYEISFQNSADSSIQQKQAGTDYDTLQDMNNVLKSSVASSSFYDFDEPLMNDLTPTSYQKREKHPKKITVNPTVEEFVTRSSPFKLPNSRNSLKTTSSIQDSPVLNMCTSVRSGCDSFIIDQSESIDSHKSSRISVVEMPEQSNISILNEIRSIPEQTSFTEHPQESVLDSDNQANSKRNSVLSPGKDNVVIIQDSEPTTANHQNNLIDQYHGANESIQSITSVNRKHQPAEFSFMSHSEDASELLSMPDRVISRNYVDRACVRSNESFEKRPSLKTKQEFEDSTIVTEKSRVERSDSKRPSLRSGVTTMFRSPLNSIEEPITKIQISQTEVKNFLETVKPEKKKTCNISLIDETKRISFVEKAASESFIDKAKSTSFIDKAVSESFVEEPKNVSLVDQAKSTSFIDQVKNTSFVEEPKNISLVDQAKSTSFIDQVKNTSFVEEPKNVSLVDQAKSTSFIDEIKIQSKMPENVLERIDTPLKKASAVRISIKPSPSKRISLDSTAKNNQSMLESEMIENEPRGLNGSASITDAIVKRARTSIGTTNASIIVNSEDGGLPMKVVSSLDEPQSIAGQTISQQSSSQAGTQPTANKTPHKPKQKKRLLSMPKKYKKSK